VAEALRPTATPASVIETALGLLSPEPLKEVREGLDRAKGADTWKDLRPFYAEKYEGRRISNAVEVLSGGLACFYIADGHPKESILYAVNLGRDTDCKAYVAGGLAGALRGIAEVPEAWVKTVDEASKKDPWTVSKRTTREAAEGLHQACLSEAARMEGVLAQIRQIG
jgi:hypothetical protein